MPKCLLALAHLQMWMSALVHPDWDMFHSKHPAARMHAMSRQVLLLTLWEGATFWTLTLLMAVTGLMCRADTCRRDFKVGQHVLRDTRCCMAYHC